MKKVKSNDLYELELLKHVEATPRLTNRQASRILGVSIKLAHDVLSKMIDKGYFHVVKHHSRRWDYFLTPTGISEKARLTMEFLDFSMRFYRQARRQSAQVCRELAESDRLRIAFIGANDLAEIAYLGVQEWGLDLCHIYDDGPKKTFMNLIVQPLEQLPDDDTDAIVVCAYDSSAPTAKGYLPQGVQSTDSMVWIF